METEAKTGTIGKMKSGFKMKNLIWFLIPLCFAVFLSLYVRSASADVVYSDYIRLTNSYLPDTLNPEKFFVADILTRIPITYLFRFLNVYLFSYSITMDRLLGISGLFLSCLVLVFYLRKKQLSIGASMPVFIVIFSLNKWEMLLNGSGYAHFLSFALFYFAFFLLDRVYEKKSAKRSENIFLCVLPFLALITAGPYVLVFLICLLIFYVFLLLPLSRFSFPGTEGAENSPDLDKAANYNKAVNATTTPNTDSTANAAAMANNTPDKAAAAAVVLWFLSAGFCLILYLISNHYAVYEYAGASNIGPIEAVRSYPSFSLHFILNGFASMVLGGEELEALLREGSINYPVIYGLGLLVAASYIFAIYLCLKCLKLAQHSTKDREFTFSMVFPFLLILYGLGSHGIVFVSRCIFLNETYAWQSRYALQYQSGILGILLVFALSWKKSAVWKKVIFALFILIITFGNLYTGYVELSKAKAREERYEEMLVAAMALEDFTDEELEGIFEYRHGGERIRRAFSILKENHLNVYR